MLDYRILALIPARRNSKGIPLKNVKDFGGRPLLAWSIEAAKKSRFPMRVVCSTDDQDIASTAQDWGAETPFLRPEHLSTDTAQTIDVVLHAVESLKEFFTHVLLLQPTSPLRTSDDIDGAVQLSLDRGADAVVSVTEAAAHPYLTYSTSEDQSMAPFFRPDGVSLRRQDLPPAFVLNGAIYVNTVDSLDRERTFVPQGTLAYPMPRERSIDIDTMHDWAQAEAILKQNNGGLG